MTERKEQVLMLPFMAHGHLIPFLSLASLLEQKTTYTITIISTPQNILTVQSSLPPNTSIRLTSLPFIASDHGLPPNSENTHSIPTQLILRLISASETLQPAFEHLVAGICRRDGPPLYIISDMFMSWSVETAHKFGILHSIFNTMGAYGTAIFISLWKHLPHKRTEADEFPLPDFPNMYLHRTQLAETCKAADGMDPWSVFFRKHFSFWQQSHMILVNTVEDLESKALQQLRIILRKSIQAIGPVLPPPPSISKPEGSVLTCAEWLNMHPEGSVLYISFGSQNSIHIKQMMELAKGLEACGKAFIWVIRPPIGSDVKEGFRSEWVPDGFEDRVTERKQGILLHGWVPQVEILSHGSTGAFLSHCGWNSTLESLSYGMPVIGWPLGADQFCNSKLLVEELGVGVELARGTTAEISGLDVVRVVGMVMDGESEKGKEMRRKARQIQELMKAAVADEESGRGSSMIALEEFLKTAVAWRENP
ncbi:UDP-glycosyltransferase 92A1-like [Magnolia sinica]|uniref:UDP-glycosyltransferase 92A1-like n=1 Tax=Magnolia sinica TaxID=86752 RepID=UPI00265989C7|nr:UDP-glycosyltransferase 92A1-like [Magnolia sinica]